MNTLRNLKYKKNVARLSFFQLSFVKKIFYYILGSGLFLCVNFILFIFIVTYLNISEFFFRLAPQEKFSGLNILVFGVDDTKTSQRSDSILVLNLNTSANHIGALSIPRDTRVQIKNYDYTRINHAYSYGGTPLLTQTVSHFLEVPVHHYLKVKINSIKEIVDLVGGVEVNIKKDMLYEDQAGNLFINLKKGHHKLSGEEAVQYLRFRQDKAGDIGRIQRQQEFMIKLSKKIFNLNNMLDFPKIIKKINDLLDTDLSLYQLLSLGKELSASIHNQNFVKGTIPGSIALVKGAYYWKPDVSVLDKEVDRVLRGFENVSNLDQKYSSSSNIEILSGPENRIVDINEKVNINKENLQPGVILNSEFEILSSNSVVMNDPDSSSQKIREVFILEETQFKSIKEEIKIHDKEDKNIALERRGLFPEEVKRMASLVDLEEKKELIGIKVEVLNGFGKPGEAMTAARILKSEKMIVPRYADAGKFDYSHTKIVDWKGNIEKSLKLANLLEIDPKYIIVYDKPKKNLDITIVLGQDWLKIKKKFMKE